MSSLVQAACGLAILYAAKSTPDEKGSIADQLKEAREYAEEQGLQVVAEYSEEDISAYKRDRGPELAKALEHAKRIGATLIAQHSDRLARGDGKQARHLVEIALWALKAEVQIHCIGDPRTFESILEAAAMGDRNMEDSRRKATAVKAGLKRRRKRGRFVGRPPLGYMLRRNEADERVLVIDEAAAETIQRIYAEFLAGKGQTAIAHGLVADGVPTREKGRWNASTVRAKLLNPIYTGLISDGESLIEATHEAIIDRKTWEQAQALHKATARTFKRGRPSVGKHLFRKGFLRCGRCGASMVPRTGRTSKGNLTESYYCYERGREPGRACDMPYITRAKVDDAVYAYFQNLGFDLEATRAQLAAAQEHKRAMARSVLGAAEQEAQRAQARLARVKGDYVSGELSAAEWRELRGELEPEAAAAEAETERLRAQLAEAESEAALSEVTGEVLALLAEVRAEIAKEVTDRKEAAAVRAVLMRLFDGFVLHRGRKEGSQTKSSPWIEPLLSELTVAGYDEKLRPALVHKPIAQAENNFLIPICSERVFLKCGICRTR